MQFLFDLFSNIQSQVLTTVPDLRSVAVMLYIWRSQSHVKYVLWLPSLHENRLVVIINNTES